MRTSGIIVLEINLRIVISCLDTTLVNLMNRNLEATVFKNFFEKSPVAVLFRSLGK